MVSRFGEDEETVLNVDGEYPCKTPDETKLEEVNPVPIDLKLNGQNAELDKPAMKEKEEDCKHAAKRLIMETTTKNKRS